MRHYNLIPAILSAAIYTGCFGADVACTGGSILENGVCECPEGTRRDENATCVDISPATADSGTSEAGVAPEASTFDAGMMDDGGTATDANVTSDASTADARTGDDSGPATDASGTTDASGADAGPGDGSGSPADASPGQCSPKPEVCDRVDNDCNGAIDEGVINICGGCGPVVRGPEAGEVLGLPCAIYWSDDANCATVGFVVCAGMNRTECSAPRPPCAT